MTLQFDYAEVAAILVLALLGAWVLAIRFRLKRWVGIVIKALTRKCGSRGCRITFEALIS